MDWLKKKEELLPVINKYKYFVLMVIAGLMLMLVPDHKTQEPSLHTEQIQTNENLQNSLQEILSLIQGAGKVSVLLTEKQGEEVLYQTDENIVQNEHSNSITKKTLMVTDENRVDQGMVRQVNPPILRGAVVVCQGADDPKVKYAIVEAVMGATGLPSSSICVLKMK